MIGSPQPVIPPPTTDPPNMINEVAVEVTEAIGEGSGRGRGWRRSGYGRRSSANG